MPVGELARWTRALDPPRAHLGRSQLLRAIEIALLTGRRLSELHQALARPNRWTARYLVVDPGDGLAERIQCRLEAMLAGGWVEEVRTLARTVPDDAPAWKATGYRTIRRVVRGELTLDAARAAVLVETRQYAKRQRTWFRHQLPPDRVTRLDPRRPDAREAAEEWWRAVANAAPSGEQP
jgi:tRNA dimethylallyltransferase